MAIVLTNEQWAAINRKLDRIMAEQMLRQPVDANVLKRLNDLEAAVAAQGKQSRGSI